MNLNELSLDNVGQWPAPIKYSILIFLMVLIVALGYWLIVMGNFNEYNNLQAQEITLKKDFEMKQHQASNLRAYQLQMTEMKDRFGNMLKQLPTQNEMPGLLEDISKTGIASGLSFELFAPMPEVLHDFYIEVPIKIIVVGNYHQFAVFLSRVAEMSRIVTLHDFVISRNESNTAKQEKLTEEKLANAGELLTMEITAKIYRYRT